MKNLIIKYLLGFVLLFSSCEDWLNKLPESQVREDAQFNSEMGFQQALIGCYIGLADIDLFGQKLSWELPGSMSNQYDEFVVSSPAGTAFQSYNYKLNNSTVEIIDKIWMKLYNVITNANNALKFIDDKKGVFYPESHSIIKGEFLAIRAFSHFELMRLYGVSNLAGRTDKNSKMAIPYRLTSEKETEAQKSYSETINLIVADLEEASKLLEFDPITKRKSEDYLGEANIDGFFDKRPMRLNYYAVRLILAKVYLWEGSPKSVDAARVIVDDLIAENTTKEIFKWTIGDFTNNYNCRSENLFYLDVINLGDKIDKFFMKQFVNTDYYVLKTKDSKAKEIFEVSSIGYSDIRYSQLLNRVSSLGIDYVVSKKYDQVAGGSTSLGNNIVPILRLSEIYLIAAECYVKGSIVNIQKANEYLSVVRSMRGIEAVLDTPDIDSFFEELKKEYTKEYYAEIGLFYYYKRIGETVIISTSDKVHEMNDEKYMLPYPQFELQSGRVQ